MTNKEWLSTLSVEELWEWLTAHTTCMVVGDKTELTKFGVVMGCADSSDGLLQWLKRERK